MQEPANEALLSPGAEADRLRFFVFARVLLDAMPGPLAVPFTTHWDAKFASTPWVAGGGSGRLLVDGIGETFEDGRLAAKSKSKEVTEAPGAALPLEHNDRILIEGRVFKVIVHPNQPVRIDPPFLFGDGEYSFRRLREVRVRPRL